MELTDKIKNFNHLTKDIKFYSNQTMEDKFLYFIYGDEPNLTFLEAGATNGIDHSMTYFLESKLNWNGICVEPSDHYKECIKNRKIVENVLLGSKNEEKLFCIFNGSNHELSCKVEDLQRLYCHDTWQRKFLLENVSTQLKILEQKTITEILSKHNIFSLNFLGLDIEGGELNAIEGIDFDKIKIDIIACEGDRMSEYLKNKGYTQIYNPFITDKSDWNTWYVSNELLKRKNWLKYLNVHRSMNIYYNDIIEKYNIMSCPIDLCIDYNIIKYNTINSIIEIGAGGGGWAVGLHNFLDRQVNITLIENFEFIKYNDDNYGKNWPKSKNELINFIDNSCKNHNITVQDIDAEVIDTYIYDTYDLIRIDCFEHEDELNKILRWCHLHLSDDGLLYIDDIAPTICINRLYSAISLVKEKMYKIVWIGDKSMILSKYESTKDHFSPNLRDLIQDDIKNFKFVIRDPVKMVGNNSELFNIKYWCSWH